MIKYNLVCKNCNKSFDSWFASSKEYEKLKKLEHINCYNCNSLQVDKNLMSPNIVNLKKNKRSEKTNSKKYANIKKTLKEYQKFIKNNFKYVGENFAYEARSIHYKDKKKTIGIYGNASLKELKELKEEGIEAEIVPWVKEEN